MAVSTTDLASVDSGDARAYRRSDRSATLIRHAGPSLSLALSIAALPMPMELPTPCALLISAVGFTPLLTPHVLAAGGTAVPLSTVATGANRKYRSALRGATDLQAKLCCPSVGRTAHFGIMAQQQATAQAWMMIDR